MTINSYQANFANMGLDAQREVLKMLDTEVLLASEKVCPLWNKIINNSNTWESLAAKKGIDISSSSELSAREKVIIHTKMPEIKRFPEKLVEALGGEKKIFMLPKLDLG